MTQLFTLDNPPPANSVTDMAITFQKGPVDVLVFRLGKCWVLVEQVGNEGQVQFGVATDHISWCDELPAAEAIRLLQHVLRPPQVILLLPGINGQELSWSTPGHKAHGNLLTTQSNAQIWTASPRLESVTN